MSKCPICNTSFTPRSDLLIHTARVHITHDTLAFRRRLNDYLFDLITAQETTPKTTQNITQIKDYLTATDPDTYIELIKIRDNLQRLPKTEKYKAMYEEYEKVLYAYMDNIRPLINELIDNS